MIDKLAHHMRFAAVGLLLALGAAGRAAPVWVPGWQTGAPLNGPRAGAAVLESNGVLYAIGGVDGVRFLDSVEYSILGADGAPGPWRRTYALNEPRGFFSAVTHGGFVYAAGGGNGDHGEHLLNTVERSRIQPDGGLGPWVREKYPMVYPRRCVKLVAGGDYIYALGGFGGTLLDSVERAPILENGALGKWTIVNTMTMPRYVNAVKKIKGAIYVLGGHNQEEGNGLRAVEFASLARKGKDLGGWRRTSPMHTGRYALSAAAHGNALYVMGGLDGAVYLDGIETSRAGPAGRLGWWRATTALSSPRANFGTVVHRDRIYVVGGTNRDGYYNIVEYASFNEDGDIGFHATPQQAALYREKAMARRRRAAPRLPNQGTVTQVIHTRAYSYIQVSGDGGTLWLAAPRTDVAVHDRIRYSRGLTMTDFHSNALERDFSAILFVERIRREE